MFPMLALAAFAGYQWARANNSNNNNSSSATSSSTTSDSTSASEKAQNVYNYYTNDSTNGNTLFNGQTQKKRTLFGNDNNIA